MEIDHIQDSPWDIYGYYIYLLVYQHRIIVWLNSMIKMAVYGRYNSSINGACKPTHITGRHHIGSLAKKIHGLLKKTMDDLTSLLNNHVFEWLNPGKPCINGPFFHDKIIQLSN